jgi:hypothetical protein
MTLRSIVWVEGREEGWSCSSCNWKFPVPPLLTSKEARDAYDRLAAAKFEQHECEEISSAPEKVAPSSEFLERARVLMKRGYTPKIAVEIVLHEMEFEHRKNPAALAKARVDADAFLERIRKGLI